MMKYYLFLICAGITGIFLLTACGKRGSLRAPEGSTYPQTYPHPSNVAK